MKGIKKTIVKDKLRRSTSEENAKCYFSSSKVDELLERFKSVAHSSSQTLEEKTSASLKAILTMTEQTFAYEVATTQLSTELSSDWVPKFLFFCRNTDRVWHILPTSTYLHRFCGMEQCKIEYCKRGLCGGSLKHSCTIHDFRNVAHFFGIEYMGTWMNTTGTEGDSYVAESSELPYYPSGLPVTHRVTYWRLAPERTKTTKGQQVVINASFHSLLLALCDALGCPSGEGVGIYASFLEKVMTGSDYVPRVREYLANTDPLIWEQRPSGIARPILLQDYFALAERAHYRYLGLKIQADRYDSTEAPPSIWYSHVYWDTGSEEPREALHVRQTIVCLIIASYLRQK